MTVQLLQRHEESFRERLAGLRQSAPWFAPKRETAAATASVGGLPSSKLEDWRFTSLRSLEQSQLAPLDFAAPENGLKPRRAYPLDELRAIRLTFVDGWLAPEASSQNGLPAGVVVADLRAAMAGDDGILARHLGRLQRGAADWFSDMNTALFQGGSFIFVPAGIGVETPVQLRFLSSTRVGSVQPRILIVLEREARLTLVEEHRMQGAGLCNAVVECWLGPGAKLSHSKLVDASAESYHLAHWSVELSSTADFSAHSLVLGGKLVRNEIEIRLGGEGATTRLDGLVLAGGDDLIDHHTRILHQVPCTTSRQHLRHVLDGSAHGVFAGRVRVEPNAQKTDAQQENRNLLLSDTARMNTMPQLEIYADDVRCSHGATLGRLDEDALFYLRTRGLDKAHARQLLVHAFASEMVEQLPLPELRRELREHLSAKLSPDPQLKELA
jgi:Fe-S cluster assembly protein SufD